MIHLRLREDGDTPRILAWSNDQVATRYMATGRIPVSAEAVLTMWFPANAITYIVEVDGRDPAQRDAIGMIGLFDIDLFSRKAELRILLGQRRGEGLGRACVNALLTLAFDRMNLHRVWLGTAAGNQAARACFEACGFRQEGVLQHDLWRDGWHDDVRYAILEDAWRSNET